MVEYVRKPTICLAWRWMGSLLNPPAWLESAIDEHRISLRREALIIRDGNCRIEVGKGDWVVKECDRGFVCVADEAFEDLYEALHPQTQIEERMSEDSHEDSR